MDREPRKCRNKTSTWASLAKRYKARVRRRFESSNAKIDKPATEPAKILPHHPLQQSQIHLDKNPRFFSTKDLEVLKNTPGYQLLSKVTLLSACRKRKKQIGVLCISLSSGMFLHNRRWIGNFFGGQLSKVVSRRFLESYAHFRKHLCCMDPSFWRKYPHWCFWHPYLFWHWNPLLVMIFTEKVMSN